jgi:hypothetical protein
MIVLKQNQSLEIVLSAAPATQLPVAVSWRGITTTTFAPDSAYTQTNGTTAVTLVGSPSAGEQRVIDFVSVFNQNAANAQVTLRVNDSGTPLIIARVTLGVDERFEYQEGNGIAVYNAAGALKTIATGTANVAQVGFSTNTLAADVTNNNATANTIADVTGLSFPVSSGNRYWFEFSMRYTAAATTTGARFAIQGPIFSELTYASEYSLTTTSRTFNDGLGAYDLPAAANASSATTAGNTAIVMGLILPTAAGNVIARFASEVASSAIVVKAGSIVRYQQI